MKTQRTKNSSTQLLRYGALVITFLCLQGMGMCQTGNLSGVVNTYTKVTSAYANRVTVSSAAGFSAGDNVLIIQMNGAAINTGNNSSYGTITEYGGAGSYELASISSIRGTVVTLNNKLINTYDSSQSVQLIKVPSYSDITVSGAINAQAWNGTTGGVVALMASGSVTLKADINVSGAGFRAGASDVVTNNNGTNRRCDSVNYFYTGTGSPAASKGEGIATPNAQNTYPAGMGAMANAGGGANTEEGGGAGGGNYGTGGNGGANSGSQQCTSNEGIGGNGLLYSNAFGHIYMGGGGGGGHTDDNGGVGGIGTPGAGGPGA
ncbi:MAG TPA: hypothetical protein VFJ29_03825, partial [Candidatus Kapabacteria bacterium]|nr:hypothetical protein [Candidatus Kapabacteria bacterium]